jgi:hypothetical protein
VRLEEGRLRKRANQKQGTSGWDTRIQYFSLKRGHRSTKLHDVKPQNNTNIILLGVSYESESKCPIYTTFGNDCSLKFFFLLQTHFKFSL